MPTPMERARHFQSRAVECRQLAQRTSSPTLQNHYMKLAQSYAVLAKAEESTVGPHPKAEQASSESAE
jgi:hypothetical protein